MDETQKPKPSQIRVGAGLEESRLNQDFLDFVRKWSTPLLLVVAMVALGFVAYQRYHQGKRDTLDAGFRDLEDVSSSPTPSPDSLAAVATQFAGVAAIAPLAHLGAGDSLMLSLQTGLKAGAKPKADGSPEQSTDVLTDADRASLLAQAAEHFQSALDETSKNAAQRSITFGALFGLAAVAESGGELDKAKASYDRIIALVDADPAIVHGDGTTGERPFVSHALLAKKRLAQLGSLKDSIVLVSEAQLPKLPALPGATPAAPIIDLPQGVTIEPVPAPGEAPTAVPPAANPATPDAPK